MNREDERDLNRAKRIVDLWNRLQPHTRRFVWAKLHGTGDGCPAGTEARPTKEPREVRQ